MWYILCSDRVCCHQTIYSGGFGDKDPLLSYSVSKVTLKGDAFKMWNCIVCKCMLAIGILFPVGYSVRQICNDICNVIFNSIGTI